jgi:hypothetical protein
MAATFLLSWCPFCLHSVLLTGPELLHPAGLQFSASCIVLCAHLMHCLALPPPHTHPHPHPPHAHTPLPTTTSLQGTGEDEDDVEASSASLVQSEEGYAPVFFSPRPLKNLVLVDEMPSLMPLTGGCGGGGRPWAGQWPAHQQHIV